MTYMYMYTVPASVNYAVRLEINIQLFKLALHTCKAIC